MSLFLRLCFEFIDEFKLLCLIKIGEFPEKLKVKLNNREDVKIKHLFYCILDLDEVPLSDFVTTIHVIKANVEKDQGNQQYGNFIGDNFPTRHTSVSYNDSKIASEIDDPKGKEHQITFFIPQSCGQKRNR